MKPSTEAIWTERIEEWARSGQSAAEFAVGKPYTSGTLTWADRRNCAMGVERDLVHDTIAPVLAWVPGKGAAKKAQPFCFEVEQVQRGQRSLLTIELSWSVPALESLIPGLRDHVRRLQTSRSAQREHITELAAYGLTFVAISVLMPGRRAKAFRKGSAPDILLDLTPNALRGVETAGRSTGGRSALLAIRNGTPATTIKPKTAGKAAALVARPDIVEVHLSLWSASPRISIMEQVEP